MKARLQVLTDPQAVWFNSSSNQALHLLQQFAALQQYILLHYAFSLVVDKIPLFLLFDHNHKRLAVLKFPKVEPLLWVVVPAATVTNLAVE